MFLETNSVAAGLQPPSAQPKTARSAVDKMVDMPFPEKIRFVLNALISQQGHVTFYITERRIAQKHVAVERRQQSVPVAPYQARSGTAFGPETAFESDTGKWILNVNGTLCYPQEEDKFRGWVEGNFHSLLNDPDVRVNQPPADLKLTRVN
jgi:hypothetical protein